MAEQGKKWRRVRVWLIAVLAVIAVATLHAIVVPAYRRAIERPIVNDMGATEEQGGDYALLSLQADRPAAEETPPAASAPAPDARPAAGGHWMAAASAATSSAAQPMLIKKAAIAVLVGDVQKAEAQVRQLVEQQGGFIAGSQITSADQAHYGYLTVRVPADRLDTLMSEVSKLGQVRSTEQEAEEVTEEYVDLQSRLRNDQREEDQLLRLMQQAGKVSDLLQVEKALADVRGRIEQTTGRLRYLENRVALATLTVRIAERSRATAAIAAWSPWEVVKGAVAGLLTTLKALATVLIWLVMFAPVLLLILVIWWLIRRRSTRAPSGA
jgi:hypothetical protein